jgi:small subunit ribosomal protein S11
MAEEQKAEKAKAEKAEKPKAAAAEGAAPAAEGAAAGAEGAAKEKVKKIKRKTDVQGCCTVKATFNNTIVSITDVKGNVVAWGSPGKVGFKGSRKSTPFAAQVAAESAAQVAIEMGMRKLDVRVKGAGAGRESAIRALKAAGMDILSIKDVTGVPHNGCRPKKRRRV